MAMTFIVWDRGKVIAFDLERFGPVREVEEINRWVLPQRLAKLGLRPVARWLRNRRVRGWWDEAGPPDLVLCLGPIRSELVNYRPDDDAPVAAAPRLAPARRAGVRGGDGCARRSRHRSRRRRRPPGSGRGSRPDDRRGRSPSIPLRSHGPPLVAARA